MGQHKFGWRGCLGIILLLSSFLAPSALCAATHYVWCNATGSGNGSSFTNAYLHLPQKNDGHDSNMVRGDTYVIAGDSSCTYSSQRFNDPVSGTTLITVRYAQASLDSGVSGWQSTFTTTPARWGGSGGACTSGTGGVWLMDSSYYVIDGMVGSGENSGAYGFYFCEPSPLSPTYPYVINLGEGGTTYNVTNNIIRHVEINGNYTSGTPSGNGQEDINQPGTNTLSNLLIDHCYFHDLAGTFFQINGGANITVQYSVLARNISWLGEHQEAWTCAPCTNLIDRYNVYEDISGTAVVDAGLSLLGGRSDNLQFYGDVFFATGTYSGQFLSLGIVADNNCQYPSAPLTNLQFNNNTISGFNSSAGSYSGVYLACSNSTIAGLYNNLWFGNTRPVLNGAGGGTNEDYNTFLNTAIETGSLLNTHDYHTANGSANPFVNSALKNYLLSSETIAPHLNDGNPLPAPYNIDPNGIPRGASGNWDRGAYQVPPLPPSSVNITGVH
ncbi:MAG: hypothetical protein ABSA59_18345 [Terriglobia bacterium]|jgi:hypothetical protein